MKRDSIDWILFGTQIASTVAAAAAVWFAVVTNKNAKQQAERSNEALVRERRIDFELATLTELAACNLRDDSVYGARAQFTLLASMLPIDLVPLARAAVSLPSTQQAREQVDASLPTLSGNTARVLLREEIQKEILAAIQLRVSQRD